MFITSGSALADSDLTKSKNKYRDIYEQSPNSDFEWALESVKLRNLDYMTSRFGYPFRSFDSPTKNKVFEYDFSKAKNKDAILTMLAGLADASGGMGIFSTLNSLGSGPLYCKFQFEANKEDVIRKWHYEGKDCEPIYQTIKTTLVSKAPTPLNTQENRVSLGIMIQIITPAIQQAFNLSSTRGALVSEVMKDSPAYNSGVKRGDVIVNFGGREINEMKELPGLIASFKPGEKVDLTYIRNGEKDKVAIHFDK